MLDVPWGKLQVFCERTPERVDEEPEIFLLRFLGARGRAEMGTTDPLNRIPEARTEVWIANSPGFGASTGPVSLQRYADAALRVFDAMREQAGARRTWVYGQSFGTAAALHVAAHRDIDWLILKNVTPVRESLRLHAPFGVKWAVDALSRQLPPELDVMHNAALASSPALFVTSQHDTVSPPSLQASVLSAYGGQCEQCLISGVHDQHILAPGDEAHYASLIRNYFFLRTYSTSE